MKVGEPRNFKGPVEQVTAQNLTAFIRRVPRWGHRIDTEDSNAEYLADDIPGSYYLNGNTHNVWFEAKGTRVTPKFTSIRQKTNLTYYCHRNREEFKVMLAGSGSDWSDLEIFAMNDEAAEFFIRHRRPELRQSNQIAGEISRRVRGWNLFREQGANFRHATDITLALPGNGIYDKDEGSVVEPPEIERVDPDEFVTYTRKERFKRRLNIPFHKSFKRVMCKIQSWVN